MKSLGAVLVVFVTFALGALLALYLNHKNTVYVTASSEPQFVRLQESSIAATAEQKAAATAYCHRLIGPHHDATGVEVRLSSVTTDPNDLRLQPYLDFGCGTGDNLGASVPLKSETAVPRFDGG